MDGLDRSLCGGDVVGCLTAEGLLSWVMRSCLAQGVPLKVTDVRVVDRVRTLLSGRPGGTERGVSTAGPHGSPSQAPDRSEPIGVEPGDTPDSGSDNGV